MCMEDVRIWRKTYSTQTIVSVSTSMVELCAPNPHRVAISISPPSSGNLSVSMNTQDSSSVGMLIGAAGHIGKWTLQDDGDIVRRGLSGVMSTGTQSITVWETFLHEE